MTRRGMKILALVLRALLCVVVPMVPGGCLHDAPPQADIVLMTSSTDECAEWTDTLLRGANAWDAYDVEFDLKRCEVRDDYERDLFIRDSDRPRDLEEMYDLKMGVGELRVWVVDDVWADGSPGGGGIYNPDGYATWSTVDCAGTAVVSANDFLIVTHELGHLAGLGHEPMGSGNLMEPFDLHPTVTGRQVDEAQDHMREWNWMCGDRYGADPR